MQTHAFSKDIKIVLLMAGHGTRWGELSSVIPKPCIPFLNYPFIDFILSYLKNWHVKDVYCNLYHLPNVILKNLEKHSDSFHFHISHELNLLGTAGGIKRILQLYGESTTFVINADVFCPIPVSPLFSYHERKNTDITLCIKPLLPQLTYTPLHTDNKGRVFLDNCADCIEKKYFYTGASLLEPRIFSRIQSDSYADLAKDVFFNHNANIALMGYKIRSFWIDIGTPQKYLDATAIFMQYIKKCMNLKWLPEDFRRNQMFEYKRKSVLLFDRNAKTGSDMFEGFVVAGYKAFIANDVYIRNSVLMQESTVLSGATLDHCIVGPSVVIKPGSSYKNKLILSRAWLGSTQPIPSTQQDKQNMLVDI